MQPRCYIFLCDSETRQTVLSRRLVGTTLESWNKYFEGIQSGDYFVIYDRSSATVEGACRIIRLGKPIERGIWRGRFPAQASFDWAGTRASIGLSAVQLAIPGFWLHNNAPPSLLTGDAAVRLLAKFDVSLDPPEEVVPPPDSPRVQPAESQRFRTLQGFLVASKAERSIADCLYRLGLECEYERPITSDIRCDFYLRESKVVIEYWGKPDDPVYRKNMIRKQQEYARRGTRLLELFPDEEAEIEFNLLRKLTALGVVVDEASNRRYPSPQSQQQGSTAATGIWARFRAFLIRLLS